ncbi:MAG: HAMP domain-containing protein, partial [bacterium]|nr:HAMP domain-containing protein [bacterium]
MKSESVATARSNYDRSAQGWTANIKSIKFKMIVLGGIPLALAIVFIVNGISTRYRTVDEMGRMLVLSQLAGKMGALVHETQRERGATAVFMGSDGTLFTSEMKSQRIKTDPRRVELDEFVKTIDPASYGTEFHNALTQALNKMTTIDTHRENVDKQTIPDAQAISFYTEHNRLMLDVVLAMLRISTNGEIGRLATAYVNFIQGKERAGIERAIMSRAFAADRFEEGALKLVSSLIIAQETFFKMFEVLATPAEADLYNQKMSNPVVAEVQRMRDIAFKKGLATGRGKQFFDLMQNLGYGGAIHNVKNFLLRQDVKFKKLFEKNYEDALSIMKQIDEFPDITEQERDAVRIIRETLEQYDSGAAAVARIINTGKTIAEVDATVKVDDGPALEALQVLGESLVIGNFGVDAGYWFDSITRKISLLKEVEDRLSEDLSQRVLELQATAQNALMILGLTAVFIVIGVLATMYIITRDITRPVNQIVRVAEGVAEGDLSQEIEIRRRNEIGQLAEAFRTMQSTITAVSQEINGLIRDVQNGELHSRGSEAAFAGNWRDLIIGMNNLIDAFVVPVNITATYLDRIAKGDVPDKIIEEANGDFNEIKNNLNLLIDNIGNVLQETNGLIQAVQDGKLDIRGNAKTFVGDWKELVEGMNTVIDAFVAPLNMTAGSLDRIAKGDIPDTITEEYKGDFNQVKNNLNTLIDAMNEITQLAKGMA